MSGASGEFILETHALTKEFKGFVAVDRVDLRVRRGTIHALIGPNGAGIGREDARDHVEDRGLARAVGADQRVDRAALHAQVHVVDGDEALELLGERARLEDELAACVAHASASSRRPAGRPSPPIRRDSAAAAASAASRCRLPRSLPSCALLMHTEIAATASPEAPNTGAPNE